MILIVESKRNQRVLDWLTSQVSKVAIANACRQLSGVRKLYVCNIASVLDLSPPDKLAVTSRDTAQRHLDVIRKFLSTHQKRGHNDGAT